MAAVFAKMETAGVAKLSEWVRIFVGVQTSADKTYFIHLDESRSTPDLAHFTDPDGKHWDIERSILRPGIQDQGIEPYGFRPEPDTQVNFPYEVEEVENKTGGRRKVARRFSLKEMEATYPKALDYFRDKEAKLKPPARSVERPPGEAFWSYGRSRSLKRLDAPKIIARVLSLTPRYAIDPCDCAVGRGQRRGNRRPPLGRRSGQCGEPFHNRLHNVDRCGQFTRADLSAVVGAEPERQFRRVRPLKLDP